MPPLLHDEEAAAGAVGQNNEARVQSRLNLVTAYLRLGRLDRVSSLLAEAATLTRQAAWYSWLWRTRFVGRGRRCARPRGARPSHRARSGRRCAGAPLWPVEIRPDCRAPDGRGRRGAVRLVRAHAHVQHALDILTVYPVPILAWKVHATAARIHWHSGRHAEAAAERDRARSEVRLLSERIKEERLKTTFLGSTMSVKL